jgi:hypothetical protein
MYTAKNHSEGPNKWVIGGELAFEAGSAVKFSGVAVSHPVHYNVSAAAAVAASNTGVHAAVALGEAAQDITTGITNPAVPRSLIIKGSASGISGNVVITGLNRDNEEIEETIALNGATAVEGEKAFMEVTSINLPAQSHTPAAQVETATVVGTVTGAGNATVIVTCTGMTGTPKTISVAVAEADDAAAVAGKIRTALAADGAVTALFDVGGEGAAVTLTRKTQAANISNLNISIDNGTCTGLTTAATSENTTAGVAPDTVSVGWGSILGLPHKLENNTVLFAFLGGTKEGTAPTVTVSTLAVEDNTVKLNSSLNGSAVDVYYLAE